MNSPPVKSLRNDDVRPSLTLRCDAPRRCGLLAAWDLTEGVLFWHGGFHVSPRRASALSTLSGSGRALDQVREKSGGGTVVPAWAHRWDGAFSVFVACEHRWRLLDPEALNDSLTTAQRLRRAVEQVIAGHGWT